MDVFDQRIIGYDSTKEILRKISDELVRTETYRAKGIVLPRGVLFVGAPGTGKSTLARCLADASGRYAVVFRRNSEGNAFLEALSQAFREAKEHSPSVLILEDIHLYSPSQYGTEWAALQSNMDEISNEVFVAATANTTDYMPDSLLRPGRFDMMLNISTPRGKLSEKIVTRFLQQKKLSSDIDLTDIFKLLDGHSYAVLESVFHIAETGAVYDHADKIERKHLITALMQILYSAGMSDTEYMSKEWRRLAVHEASHAIVNEVLTPGSTSVVSIMTAGNGCDGFTDYCRSNAMEEEDLMNAVIVSLAGKAGVEVILGKFDMGADNDIDAAYRRLYNWATQCAGGGFGSVESGYYGVSDQRRYQHEQFISVKLEELYGKAKRIVYEKRNSIEQLSKMLLEEKVLLNSDIRKIMEE